MWFKILNIHDILYPGSKGTSNNKLIYTYIHHHNKQLQTTDEGIYVPKLI